ncbi:MAG: hypothetical protein FIA97_01540 [Methylococcaceae bacterium]|nr:hypothetical protein [Methylococcaceae bacterium]
MTTTKIQRRTAELQRIRDAQALEAGIHPAQLLYRLRSKARVNKKKFDWDNLQKAIPPAVAAGLLVAGLSFGFGCGVILMPQARPPMPVESPPAPPVSAGDGLRGLSPELEAIQQLLSFGEALPPVQPNPTDQPLIPLGTLPNAPAENPRDTAGAVGSSTDKPILDPSKALARLRSDRTWNRHLHKLSARLLAEDHPDQTLAMVNAMDAGDAKWGALLAIADYHQNLGNSEARNQILGNYRAAVDTLDGLPQRIGALGLLARTLTNYGESERALEVIRAAEELPPRLTNQASQIAAGGYLAGMYVGLGDDGKAQIAWKEVNRLIIQEKFPQTRLIYYIDLANAYSHSGRQNYAVPLLSHVSRYIERLPEADRAVVLRSLALAFAKARDPQSALEAISRMNSAEDPQGMILDLIGELLAQGLPYGALSLAEHLGDPIFRSRAEAAIAWSLTAEGEQNSVAQSLFRHANELLKGIAHPVDQAIAMGDVGRYQYWAEQVDTVPILSQATAAAQRINEPRMRDFALALVAGEYARAGQWPSSREHQAMIGDPAIAAAVGQDTDRVMTALAPPHAVDFSGSSLVHGAR